MRSFTADVMEKSVITAPFKWLWKGVLSVGPAFFLAGYTIGTGSVVTMASAGSRYGLTLLWVLVLACAFSFILLEAYGRFSLVTGTGSLYGTRKHIPGGKVIALTVLAGLVIVEVMALAGNMGIISDLVCEWSGMVFGSRWNPVWVAVVMGAVVYGLLMMGKYASFEKIMVIFVGMMAVSFFITMFLVMPQPEEVVRGFLVRVPEASNAPMILAAIVGTTFTAPTFVVRSILMKEKKWKSGELRHARKDAAMSALMMFVVSFPVMACAAGTLYVASTPVDRVVTMVALLEPLLGKFAISVFVTGILGAALSSMIPILMLAPLLISDYRNEPVNYRGSLFRIMCGVALLFGLAVPILHASPVFAMLISQVFQVFILPVVIFAIIYLLNKKELMGKEKAGPLMNTLLVLTFLFTLIISWQGVMGLLESIHTLF